MINVFKDIQKDKRQIVFLAKFTIVSSLVFALFVLCIGIYIIFKQYNNIYVANSRGALEVYQMEDIKTARLIELDAFCRDFLNLSFYFVPNNVVNKKQVGRASLFVSDESFKNYIERLRTGKFWDNLASHDLMQGIKSEANGSDIKLNIVSGSDPFVVKARFGLEIKNVVSLALASEKVAVVQMRVHSVPRTYSNPHGFKITDFEVNIVSKDSKE